jgi:hypothetical protein
VEPTSFLPRNNDANYGSRRFFVGEIDDVRSYQAALAADEAKALYDQGPE